MDNYEIVSRHFFGNVLVKSWSICGLRDNSQIGLIAPREMISLITCTAIIILTHNAFSNPKVSLMLSRISKTYPNSLPNVFIFHLTSIFFTHHFFLLKSILRFVVFCDDIHTHNDSYS